MRLSDIAFVFGFLLFLDIFSRGSTVRTACRASRSINVQTTECSQQLHENLFKIITALRKPLVSSCKILYTLILKFLNDSYLISNAVMYVSFTCRPSIMYGCFVVVVSGASFWRHQRKLLWGVFWRKPRVPDNLRCNCVSKKIESNATA